MKKTIKKPSAKPNSKNETLRFAHPFYTSTPLAAREVIPGVGTRMTDHIKTKLEKIPRAKRKPEITLEEIIGAAGVSAIENEKQISFHSVGDTGYENGTAQEMVADAMSKDFNINKPEQSPAFFLHLGDVIYYDNTDKGYHAQFYIPYKKYPGKIIAIPGNHDGELFKWDNTSTGQKITLEAFQKNFCLKKSAIPPAAGSIYRQSVSQPAVYWLLKSPFVNIIGLYSNVAENPGYIQGGAAGTKQKTWLTKTLAALRKERTAGKRKALVIAVHHAPISEGSHSSSTEMLADIDDSCTKSGIMPDAVLAAHSHDYQRFTRYVSFQNKNLEIPFIVAGSGGRGISSRIAVADGSREGDHTFDKYLKGYGYLTITVSATILKIEFYQVNNKTGAKKLFDKVSVNLKTNRLK